MDGRHRPRLRDASLTRLIPNMLTVLALCAGLTAIRFALQQQWDMAVAAILVAGVLDGLDGRIARLLHGASRFGAELDSLADFISFGVAPAVILYQWTMHRMGGFGWALAILFAVSCALRLARFNTWIENADLPAWRTRFFTGVPAPGAAGLALLPMFASFEFGPGWADHPAVVGAVMVAVSLLMVSQIPSFSLKRVRVPHNYVAATLVGAAALAAFLVSMPWLTLMGMGLVYVLSLPVSYRAYRRLERQAAPAALGVEEPRQPVR